MSNHEKQQAEKEDVLSLQQLSEIHGGTKAMSWSTESNKCGTVTTNEWSTWSNGCKGGQKVFI
jgi:hypothetical protein